jgi:hypothetical protein
VNRRLHVAASIAAVLVLSACTAATPASPSPDPSPEPEPERFASRQLDTIALSIEDFGGAWLVNEDPSTSEDGRTSGSGPGGQSVDQPDICGWNSSWLPDPTQFYTHSWRTYTTGDGATFAQAWTTAVEPGVSPADLLTELGDVVEACETVPDPAAQPDGTITLVPDTLAQLGEGSYSYRADFAHPDLGVYGLGEVHTVLCGQLWLHLSYIGYEAFVERDGLLETMLERAAPLGGCTA